MNIENNKNKKTNKPFIISTLLFCLIGVFAFINKNDSVPVKETLPTDYFEPSVKPYNGYDEVIPYVVGSNFVIKDYVEVKAYGDEYRIYFETTGENATPTSYQNVGMHPITIHVIDKYKHEALCKTNLLTEKEEVINTLCADDYKPKVSDYENLQKKMADEQAEAQKKAKEEAKKQEEQNPYGPGYDPNSRAVQVAQNLVDTASGSCNQIADQFMFTYFGLSSISDNGFYEVSESNAVPGDLIVYQSGKGHVAIYLGGGMALHGGIGGNNVRIMGVNALSNVSGPKYYRYDASNPNGYASPYDGSTTSYKVDENGQQIGKRQEESSGMSYDEWQESLPQDIKALRDACDINYETMDREAAKNSPECIAYRDAAFSY